MNILSPIKIDPNLIGSLLVVVFIAQTIGKYRRKK